MQFRSVLLWGSFLGVSVAQDAYWVEGENCPEDKGVVTDSICCGGENFCSKLLTENDCTAKGDPFMYCNWDKDKCQPALDSRSDVCCIGRDVKDPCFSLFNGICPAKWQVDKDCCSEDGRKYAKSLKSDEGKVCCNAPCMEMEKANCTNLPEMCAPQQRSLAMMDPLYQLGFHGDHKNSFRHKFGYVMLGSGFGHDYGYGRRRFKHGGVVEEDDHYDFSKEDHVDEITMDDLMCMMIASLEKQSDVKLYDAEITSDPYLGKRRSGGLFVDHSFPDTEEIFDRIYGRRGHYEYFVRPFEGYTKIYPERRLHYLPYQYPPQGLPSIPYPQYALLEPHVFGHQLRHPQSYQSNSYEPEGFLQQGHYPRGYQQRGYEHEGYQHQSYPPPGYQHSSYELQQGYQHPSYELQQGYQP